MARLEKIVERRKENEREKEGLQEKREVGGSASCVLSWYEMKGSSSLFVYVAETNPAEDLVGARFGFPALSRRLDHGSPELRDLASLRCIHAKIANTTSSVTRQSEAQIGRF
jgi:hypothetical protein